LLRGGRRPYTLDHGDPETSGTPREASVTPSARKPHRDFAGYVCELRNKYSGGHTVVSDCKRAEEQGAAIVQNYAEEGGRYQVLCNEHGTLVYCTNLPVARECMKDPTEFCMICRVIAGEGPEDWERTFAPHEVAQVWTRRGQHLAKRVS
jgi:hypothetical protein